MIGMYTTHRGSENLERQVREDFPGQDVRVDEELAFYRTITPLIEERQELCTIRFRPGTVRIPGYYGDLPWIETDADDPEHRQRLGIIRVPLIVVARLEEFPAGFARLDGYLTKDSMVEDIEGIYSCTLQPTDVLSGYVLGQVQRTS